MLHLLLSSMLSSNALNAAPAAVNQLDENLCSSQMALYKGNTHQLDVNNG
jgi:hypothetical protein